MIVLQQSQLDAVVEAADAQRDAYEEQLSKQQKRILELEAALNYTSNVNPVSLDMQNMKSTNAPEVASAEEEVADSSEPAGKGAEEAMNP